MGQVMNRTSTKPGFRLRGIQSWGKGMITYVCNMFLHIYFFYTLYYIYSIFIYIILFWSKYASHMNYPKLHSGRMQPHIFPIREWKSQRVPLSWWKMARFLLECHVRISNFPWLNQPFVAIFGWPFPKMLVKLSVCWSRKSNSSQYSIFGW